LALSTKCQRRGAWLGAADGAGTLRGKYGCYQSDIVGPGSELILASIVRRYRVDADPTHVPKVVGRVTVRSGNGVRVRLHRR